MPGLEAAMRRRSKERSVSRNENFESGEEISRMRSTFYQKYEKDPMTINIMNAKKKQAKEINTNLTDMNQYLSRCEEGCECCDPGYVNILLRKLLQDQDTKSLIAKEEGEAKNILRLLEKVLVEDPSLKKTENTTDLKQLFDMIKSIKSLKKEYKDPNINLQTQTGNAMDRDVANRKTMFNSGHNALEGEILGGRNPNESENLLAGRNPFDFGDWFNPGKAKRKVELNPETGMEIEDITS